MNETNILIETMF